LEKAASNFRELDVGPVSRSGASRVCRCCLARNAGNAAAHLSDFDQATGSHGGNHRIAALLPNVSLGTSVESADYLGRIDDLRKVDAAVRFVSFEPLLGSVVRADLSGIHWAIVGGESGPRSRPMAEQWVAEIETACRKARTAFFFKQWGGVRKKSTGRHYRGRTFDEMPRAVAMS
jgi:protein gp37